VSAGASAALLIGLAGASTYAAAAVRHRAPAAVSAPRRDLNPAEIVASIDDSLRGRSGALYARFITADASAPGAPLFRQLFGDAAVSAPGVYAVDEPALAHPFAFIALRPFSDKDGVMVGGYHVGYWPAEQGAVPSPAYANPAGFIEVTPENESLHVSEHFRLRDFLTHDQANVWPKYLVLREDLVDKLELVIAELERSGVPVRHMTVMSGFRTPEYNAGGGDPTGRAEMSRHMYGDASDVFVDNDGDGRMDDLNHDGRVDYRDAQVILAAEERVERAHPELVGGGGVYRATRTHGPFTHVDVRGVRSRWGLLDK
jgi:hypothetical protein